MMYVILELYVCTNDVCDPRVVCTNDVCDPRVVCMY